MARGDLTAREAGILLVLLAQGRKISNKELKDRWDLTLDGASRRKLNELKLVESSKVKGHGNVLFHDLTDRGWARFRDELVPRMSVEGTVPAGMLFAFAEGVERYLVRERKAVSDFFRADSTADIEAAVRKAYAQFAAGPGDWVRLAKIRLLLGDAQRLDVDRTLRRMARQPDVRIVPDEDQKSLTAADREAAVRIGEHDNHLLLIGMA